MLIIWLSVLIVSSLLTFSLAKGHLYRKGLVAKRPPFIECKKCQKASNMVNELADPNSIPIAIKGHKYPAKSHNVKVKELLLKKNPKLSAETTAVFIAGEEIEGNKYCDTEKPFRQNRYFYYLSGVDIPGSLLLFDFRKDRLLLFLPDIEWDDVIWSGLPIGRQQAAKQFEVDDVFYFAEIEDALCNYENYTIFTTDLDNVHKESIKRRLTPRHPDLFYALDEARKTKDWYEIEVLKKAAEITDKCHLAVMSALPIELNEVHIQAEFTYHAIRQGARSMGYDPICCSGPACGTLHYIKNSEDLAGKASVLIDCGAEWKNYTSDVTRCFPLTGKFTREHRQIYDAVRDMQAQVMKKIMPGVNWEDLHLLSHRVLIKHLLKLGIFRSQFSEEEIFRRRASCAFYPHGLGHLMGLDVHDVAGRPQPQDSDPYFKYLRIRRPLEENMIVTNEPGCYFNEFLIAEFLNKVPEREEVVDKEVLKKYMYIGGVRIEDDILVTKHGSENLTKITSDPDEIEKIVSGGLAKNRFEFHVVA
ncbi:YFR006W [Zygosaccharomyces parabailii]|nr:YFR006W [Zygosaccharomyces parabailii]